jgi:hypothetical protein
VYCLFDVVGTTLVNGTTEVNMLIWLPHDGFSHDVKMDKQTKVTAGCIVGRLESVLYFMIALTPR